MKAGKRPGAGKSVFLEVKKKKAKQFFQQDRFAEAGDLLEEVCARDRRDVESWTLLGVVLDKLGRREKAVECLRQVVKLRPDSVEGLHNLAVSLHRLGEWDELIAIREQIIDLAPDDSENRVRLGSLYQAIKQLPQKAVEQYLLVLEKQPARAGLFDSLAAAYLVQGCYAEAIAAHEKALRLEPANPRYHANLLMSLNYVPEKEPQAVYEAHVEWGRRHGDPKAHNFAMTDPNPARKLRIGYVSPDFRTHSVAYFIEPILANHDKELFEIFCYSAADKSDDCTTRLRAQADHWREIAMLDNRRGAEMVRSDKIDILVDLSGHTAGNRLDVFVGKPAPLQVTYLGYPNTTGLPGMDYRISDALADPVGQGPFYVEQLFRLGRCFLCYRPSELAPAVSALPALAHGFVTFGSFNNLAKINASVVALWAKVLQAVPGSRLLVKNPSLSDPAARERLGGVLAANGIGPERFALIGLVPEVADHFGQYNRVDIGLDTFPYNGTTTTCEALWMGVPVLTLAGDRHAGRVGASLLTALGRPEWIAREQDDYVKLAAALAGDLAGLAEIRAALRAQVATSSLGDAPAMARALEDAYRRMWHALLATATT